MRRTILLLLLALPALACGAAQPVEGRWEGPVRIPGKDLTLVVDLAQDRAGTWTGSIIVPGQGIKGEPLTNLVVAGTDVTFDVGGSLASATQGPAGFKAHLTSADGMAGEMRQGGNTAGFSLTRVAPAQVESPQRSTKTNGPATSSSAAIRATSRSPSKITPAPRQRPRSSPSASKRPICRSISSSRTATSCESNRRQRAPRSRAALSRKRARSRVFSRRGLTSCH